MDDFPEDGSTLQPNFISTIVSNHQLTHLYLVRSLGSRRKCCADAHQSFSQVCCVVWYYPSNKTIISESSRCIRPPRNHDLFRVEKKDSVRLFVLEFISFTCYLPYAAQSEGVPHLFTLPFSLVDRSQLSLKYLLRDLRLFCTSQSMKRDAIWSNASGSPALP